MSDGLERTAINPMTGRTGTVSPTRQGVTRTAVDPLQALLRQAAESPEYGNLVEFLSARRMMPPIQYGGAAGEGSFHTNTLFGNELPRTGEIRLSYRADPNTVVHELTHAADNRLTDLFLELQRKRGLTPTEKQFVDTYRKLVFDERAFRDDPAKMPRTQMAERMSPDWAAKKQDYRASYSELPAFGMGSTVSRNEGYPAPLHLDPTMATEFSILLDLANRIQKTQPVSGGR